MIVCKFGGTSVADAAAIRRAAEIIRGRQDRHPVVVVSALAGTTSALLAAAEQAASGNLVAAIATVESSRERHMTAVSELLGDDAAAQEIAADVSVMFDELAHLMLTQKACFNSPVWFNVGVKETRGYGWYYDESTNQIEKIDPANPRPQCSACFINSVGDTLESILDLAKTEGMLFKWGSGTGSNLSTLREEEGLLSGGGRASGPLSFMKGFDAFAGVIMVILNADHPDIEAFIWCKAKEEKKAHTLIDAGYDSSLDGEAYSSIFFQNANNSVRVTDEFMEAVINDGDWWTKSRLANQPLKRYTARDLMHQIAEATHQCGDPGMQYDTTVNRWHTSANTARINASNPCSEYMFLDDSACNLASLNLMKFVKTDGVFDVEAYRHAVRVPHRKNRPELARFPPAGPGLCQPWRVVDVHGTRL